MFRPPEPIKPPCAAFFSPVLRAHGRERGKIFPKYRKTGCCGKGLPWRTFVFCRFWKKESEGSVPCMRGGISTGSFRPPVPLQGRGLKERDQRTPQAQVAPAFKRRSPAYAGPLFFGTFLPERISFRRPLPHREWRRSRSRRPPFQWGLRVHRRACRPGSFRAVPCSFPWLR